MATPLAYWHFRRDARSTGREAVRALPRRLREERQLYHYLLWFWVWFCCARFYGKHLPALPLHLTLLLPHTWLLARRAYARCAFRTPATFPMRVLVAVHSAWVTVPLVFLVRGR